MAAAGPDTEAKAASARERLGGGADVVIADLEDAVAPGSKDAARAAVAALAAEAGAERTLVVRINAEPGLFEADLDALAGLPLTGVLVPKASTELLDELPGDGPPALALVETAAALRDAHAIAAHPRCARLLLGSVDLGAELGLGDPEATDTDPLLFPRAKLVMDSAAARVPAPVDGVHAAPADLDGLRRETERARALGMTAKQCIHPRQLDVVHGALAPDPGEVERAETILSAWADAEGRSEGAFALDGEMVDLAVVKRARRVVAMAGRA